MARPSEWFDRNTTVMRARELRRTPTLPEGLLWQVLRRRPDSLKFRRQHPIGPYIADFYCASEGLVVEIDGESHGMGVQPHHDLARDRWLQNQGLYVIRFNAADVMKDLESVVTAIRVACRR